MAVNREEENPKGSDILHLETRIYLSGDFQDNLEVKIVSSDGKFEMRADEKKTLSCTHEEADTQVFLHTAVAIQNGSERVIICASDTDIVVMALFHFKQL